MNQVQINAQIAALVDQRNAAQNQVVNLTGALAVANTTIQELTTRLDAAVAEGAANSKAKKKARPSAGKEVNHG